MRGGGRARVETRNTQRAEAQAAERPATRQVVTRAEVGGIAKLRAATAVAIGGPKFPERSIAVGKNGLPTGDFVEQASHTARGTPGKPAESRLFSIDAPVPRGPGVRGSKGPGVPRALHRAGQRDEDERDDGRPGPQTTGAMTHVLLLLCSL
jgi:hypothetical protein